MLLVQDGLERVELDGRLAVLVRWLVKNPQRIQSPQNVQITFNCAAAKVSVEIKEREPVELTS